MDFKTQINKGEELGAAACEELGIDPADLEYEDDEDVDDTVDSVGRTTPKEEDKQAQRYAELAPVVRPENMQLVLDEGVKVDHLIMPDDPTEKELKMSQVQMLNVLGMSLCKSLMTMKDARSIQYMSGAILQYVRTKQQILGVVRNVKSSNADDEGWGEVIETD